MKTISCISLIVLGLCLLPVRSTAQDAALEQAITTAVHACIENAIGEPHAPNTIAKSGFLEGRRKVNSKFVRVKNITGKLKNVGWVTIYLPKKAKDHNRKRDCNAVIEGFSFDENQAAFTQLVAEFVRLGYTKTPNEHSKGRRTVPNGYWNGKTRFVLDGQFNRRDGTAVMWMSSYPQN